MNIHLLNNYIITLHPALLSLSRDTLTRDRDTIVMVTPRVVVLYA